MYFITIKKNQPPLILQLALAYVPPLCSKATSGCLFSFKHAFESLSSICHSKCFPIFFSSLPYYGRLPPQISFSRGSLIKKTEISGSPEATEDGSLSLGHPSLLSHFWPLEPAKPKAIGVKGAQLDAGLPPAGSKSGLCPPLFTTVSGSQPQEKLIITQTPDYQPNQVHSEEKHSCCSPGLPFSSPVLLSTNPGLLTNQGSIKHF